VKHSEILSGVNQEPALLDLSVMNRRPVAVVQMCSATDVCCAAFLCREKAQGLVQFYFRTKKGSGTSRKLLKRRAGRAICCMCKVGYNIGPDLGSGGGTSRRR
jgi:hypothetical protein